MLKGLIESGTPTTHAYAAEYAPGAAPRERAEIPDQYKWDLAELFSDEEQWCQTKAALTRSIPQLERYRGGLCQSARALLDCLELVSHLTRELRKLGNYASLSSDLDTRDGRWMGMKQEMGILYADFEAAASFLDPEILGAGREIIEDFLRDEPALSPYRHNLDDVLRRAPHTGSSAEEKIIAEASLLADGPGSIYNIFANADFPYPEVELTDGQKVRLDSSAFSFYRTLPNRQDREKVFRSFFGKLHEYRRTYGAQLYAAVKGHLFYMRARKYPSTLESALDHSNVPPTVYHRLLSGVNENLPTFHRYLQLRQRMMGLDELHYFDLYAPLVAETDLKYSIEDAQRIVLDSLSPLGEAYVSVVQKSFGQRWLDVFSSPGKRSGAYSNGSLYDSHPFILLNYNGLYSDVSTLTHEMGHAMHSFFSNRTQPFSTADYSIFVAEVASTFNEALLIEHLLKTTRDEKVRLSLLGHCLEGFKGTVFRQTQFAEFELKLHTMAEKGEALTGDALEALYETITRKYYGHERKLCLVDEMVKSEWCYVPHFYYNFYVYQYATAFTASTALSVQILEGDVEARNRYLNLLSAGGSDYPIELLKTAGVDLTTSQPLELTLRKMNQIMDEMEEILQGR